MSALLATLMAAADPSAIAVASPEAAPADTSATAPQAGEDIVVTGARTEGSQDYTIPGQTTATRMNLSLRDTPQSVSVVTRAQIEDFQLNDVNTLLGTVPGINVQAGETDRVYFSARGFDIQTFQIDGIGVPFAFGIQTGSIDTAFYDHIEVVRGAPGLLSSTGNPSAVVNFIRKRPTRDLQVRASAQYGSFDQYRGEADLSVPITKDGSIRARAVGAYQDGDSYLDRYGLRRWVGYGIVEADLGTNTTVSGGYGHQDHKSRGAMWGAIPLTYTDGTPLNFDRSSNVAPDWSSWNVIDRQIFGDITHRFGNGWIARASAIRRATDENNTLFYVYGNPVRGAPNGIGTDADGNPAGIASYPGKFRATTRNLTMEAYITGPVTLLGREHEINIGVNRSAQEYVQLSSYDNSTIGNILPYPGLFDGNFPLPNFPTTFSTDPASSQNTHTRRETVYGLVRLNPGDGVKVMFGGNVTHAKSTGFSYGANTDFDATRFLPFAGATVDLSRNISIYGSWATIFNPQNQLLDINDRIIDPIEGENLEVGLKGEWFDGRLNATLAAFQTRQDNTAEAAGIKTVDGVTRTYYQGIDARSQGLELDVGGQLAPGLQVTGGYTVMRIEDPGGRPVRRYVARNTGRLNVSYTLPMLPALKLGAAAQYQSRIISPTGLGRQGNYALLDLLAAYSITPNVSAAVNLRNVTNTKYLTATNFDGGYYGAPRTVMGTISVRY
ncbi:outer-membrane receptor for ferric coprogen and ferric-rhodotorulic acid [Sphingomonas palmae]|uniref:Outer-membrane receptor for ferric coprogen and ferric-rhodotorulic acid n=1 Tax=Sphingomonas palmae TaxID=1855283 RepID=A0A1H7UWP6_9SPHN|nr:TonB-dependent siderophore receptor [Sphingomonas palmae]SEM01392.1 outer-membrane receptor for ferric coprogen and ferric-rhodotorulic acid [Sphingomonas palmae]